MIMRITRLLITLLAFSQFPQIALAQDAEAPQTGNKDLTAEQAIPADSHVATAYFFLSSMGGSPGSVKVELNGKAIGSLHPHSGLAIELIPDTENELVFRSIYSGINKLSLHADQAGSQRFYKIFVEPFNLKALRVEPATAESGNRMGHQYTFVKPSVPYSSPSVYPESLKTLYKTCQTKEREESCCDIPSCNRFMEKTPLKLQAPEFKSHYHS